MKGAQLGGTECILSALGYVIDHAPGPVLLVQPTVELAKRFSRQRLEPLIAATPRLAGKVAPARARNSGNTVLSKEFPGGICIIAGANSAVGLRSIPAQYAFLDEIDAYPVDVNDEGSPIALVEARQRTFSRRKRIKVSTPTLAGRSAIEAAYLASDQRRYYLPCPGCDEYQPLEFERLVWTKLGLPPERAIYECRACGAYIENHQKTELLARGEWRPENPDADPKVRGYHVNALYSPVGWMSWGEIATQFVVVHKDPEKHRAFKNTVLGETWQASGEAPDWEALMHRRRPYRMGTVPRGVLFLTAGADVQRDRIVVEIVGWGRGKRSWSIDFLSIPGDTADLDRGPWPQLDALLARTYPHESGAAMPVRMLAIDSGYNTQAVYAWSRRHPMNRVIAVKGQAHGGVLIGSPSPVEVTLAGQRLQRGARVWPVCVTIAKSELYGFLRLDAPLDGSAPPPGACAFPVEYGAEYFRELTAEQLIPHRSRRGYLTLEWTLIPGRENHALDCRIYARAAAALIGLDRFQESDWAALERALSSTDTPASLPAPRTPRGGPSRYLQTPWTPRW
jgi:phage terminase large subunit GpA-like protein